MRRRTPGAVAPAELLTFDPDQWPSREWWQSIERWSNARHQRAKQHSDSPIGNVLQAMQEERRLADQQRQRVFRGAAS